jgi:site-specific DNA-methyltransferase (adenine-specific)
MSLVPVIRAYSLPGDIVLDAFCGSASTCAAALLTGRRYIGIELDPDYYQAASERMTRVHGRIAARRRFSTCFPRRIHDACVPARLKACDLPEAAFPLP